jgi:hypothetical protein
MRVADRPLPTSIVIDPGALADWPVRPVFALEQAPIPPYVWDDGTVWDAAGAVWDAATALPAWADATCAFTGCEIEYDGPDEHNQFPAARCVLQLDNTSGRWARYNVDGSPADFGAGRQLWIWAKSATAAWWLFAGRIARYDERADDTIEIEAFDYFSDLAQPIGTYTPGANGDLPAARLAAIMTAAVAPLVRTRFAPGTVRLTAQATELAPLEEMEVVTGSDGGVLYGDADGTIVSTDRLWRAGRTDQTAVPVVATNVCTAPIVLWDPVVSTNDQALAGAAVLQNVAGLKASASNPNAVGRFVYAETDQQWTTQTEGDTLAAWIVAQQWQPRISLDSADLYLTDPAHNLWGAVDWRRGDRIRILHNARTPQGVMARIDVEAVLIGLGDSITPDGWVRSIATSRAVAYIAPTYWDQTALRWDDPGAVWGY